MLLLIAAAAHGLVLSGGLAPPARAGVPVAALGELPSASADFPADLSALTRRELQQLAKRMGVRANQKSVDMITQLHALVAAEASGAAEPQQAEQRAPSERRQASAPEPRQDASASERRQEASATGQRQQASAPERAPAERRREERESARSRRRAARESAGAEPQTRFSGVPTEVQPSRPLTHTSPNPTLTLTLTLTRTITLTRTLTRTLT